MSALSTQLTPFRAVRPILVAVLLLLAAVAVPAQPAHAQDSPLVFTIEAPGVQTSQVTCPAGLAVENFDSATPGATTAYSSVPLLANYTAATVQPFIIFAADAFGGAGGAGNYIATDIGEAYVLTLLQPAGYFGFWWSAGNGNNEITVNLQGGASQTFSTQAIMDAPGLVSGPPPTGHFGNPNSGDGLGEVYAFVNIFATDPGAKITSLVFSEKPGGFGRFESDNHTTCPDILDPGAGSPVPQTGTIVIKKMTEPAGGAGFGFTQNIDLTGPFSLDDGGVKTFDDVPIGEYTVAEDSPPTGYALSALTCEDSVVTGQASTTDLANRTATIKLEMGETVTCTFTNKTSPLAVSLGYAYAERLSDGTVYFIWETATESGNAGFNLYLEAEAGETLLTPDMVPSQVVDSLTPVRYTYAAAAELAGGGDRYVIELVEIDGGSERYGPFELGEAYGTPAALNQEEPGVVTERIFLPVITR